MSFDIKFDYRFDELGFFTSKRKAVLEAAAEVWSAYIKDEFDDVTINDELQVPIASITEETNISSQATGADVIVENLHSVKCSCPQCCLNGLNVVSEGTSSYFSIEVTNKTVVLDEPIDDLLIFAYSLELPDGATTLGQAGPFGSYIIGSDLDERYNGNDFQPWLGTVFFNHNADFYFDSTPLTDDVPDGQNDFFSVALHEIGHILGIGAAPIFQELTDEAKMEFKGERSMALNGGEPVPLDDDLSHIHEDHEVQDVDALLEPTSTQGEKNLLTELDIALLEDIGYETNSVTQTVATQSDTDSVVSSTSLTLTGGTAQIAYVAYYGRPGDKSGLDYWNQVLTDNEVNYAPQDGDSLTGQELQIYNDIVNQFGASAEAERLFGAFEENWEKVNQVYQFAFNRNGDSEGLDYWTKQIEQGNVTLATFALEVALGARNNDIVVLNNKIESADLFTNGIDTRAEIDSYQGSSGENFGRSWLSQYGSTTVSALGADLALSDLTGAI